MFHVSDQPIKSHFAGDQPISFSDRHTVGFHSFLTGFSSDLRFASQSPPANFKAAKRRSVFKLYHRVITHTDVTDVPTFFVRMLGKLLEFAGIEYATQDGGSHFKLAEHAQLNIFLIV